MMMKEAATALMILMLISMVFIAGCAGNVGNVGNVPANSTTQTVRSTISAEFGKEFSISLGQTAQIKDSPRNLNLEFIDVVEDSRCPSGVECFWEGQVVVAMNAGLTRANERMGIPDLLLGEFNLTKRAGREELGERTLGGNGIEKYSVKLVKVEPYPASGSEIKKPEYKATLVVSKPKE